MSRSKTQPTLQDRRRFLKATWSGVGASLSLSLIPGGKALAAPPLGANPFTLGVASGDPTDCGIVLWTRLAPEPADPGSLGVWDVPVRWRVARDEQMRHVVARGTAVAPAALAHSVHVEVHGLQPGRDYFYQFDVRREESVIGRFKTAPASLAWAQELRFAFATCQDWPSGYYTAYRDMVQQDLDLVLHLGDYTYEYAIGWSNREEGVPVGFQEETVDLRTYRLRHTLYKLDPDLQAVHARFPFSAIWDDHELQNDYSGFAPEWGSPSPEFTTRRAAAYQAYYEHMPIRQASMYRPGSPWLRIYRHLDYGRLLSISLLDDRQYRNDNPCGDGESFRCPEAETGDYTMLGHTQERWLRRGFANSHARWNVVAQQLLIAQLEHATIAPGWFWNDAWDGYPRARQRLLEDVVGTGVRNPVFLTGDWHSTFVNDLKLDFSDPASRTVATEFVTPAITTGGDGTPYGPYYGPMVPFNPHIRYYEGDRRGYFMASVTKARLQVDLRFVSSVEDRAGVGATEASWVVEDGQPGAVPA